MDRISELPPCIIHHIMSYLSSKEVAKTSILSHQWKNLQTSFPILDFDQRYFFNVLDATMKIKNFRNGTREFMQFVDGSLNRFCELKLCLEKFRLFITLLDRELSSLVDKWIGFAIENGVKEFYMKNLSYKTGPYTLPRAIFSAKSLTTLKLVRCELEVASFTTTFYSLKILSLERVYVNEEMLQKFISECPLLEDLAFSYCSGLKHFRVAKALKLKNITFKRPLRMQMESVEVAVLPSLQELTLGLNCSGPKPRVVRCPLLETLTLHGVNLRDLEFNHFISEFPMLENLVVTGCHFLERIKISSDRLKNLEFSWCHNLREIDIDTPHLFSFTYNRNPIPIASVNASCPWEVYFETKGGDLDTRWLIKLKEFLGQSKQIKRLPIAFKCEKVSLNLYEVRESFPPFPFQVGILELSIMNVPSSEYEALLNGLFSICSPKILTVPMILSCEKKLSRWLYEKLRNKDVNCCSSRHIKCWRHNFKVFKDMKINFNGSKWDVINLMDGLPVLHGDTLQFYIH